jgi:hypothetical protein
VSISNATGATFKTGAAGALTLNNDISFDIGTVTGSNGLFDATSGTSLDYNGKMLTFNMTGVLAEGNYTFNVVDAATLSNTPGSFTLTGSYSHFGAALSNTHVGNAYFTFDSATGVLSVTAVPEPHEYAIAFAGLLGVLIVLRRRRLMAA